MNITSESDGTDTSQYGIVSDDGIRGVEDVEGVHDIDEALLNESVYIFIRILDGRSFKSLIDSVAQVNKTGVFIFNDKGFKYNKNDEESHFMIDIEIIGSKLSAYSYISKRPEYIIELDNKTLKNNLSQMGTKDGIQITKDEKVDALCFRRIPPGSIGKIQEDETFSTMSIPRVSGITVTQAPEYIISERSPTVFTNAKSLKNKMSPVLKSSPSTVSLVMNDYGVTIGGMNVERTFMAVTTFQSTKPRVSPESLSKLGLSVSPVVEPDRVEVTFKPSILKFLSKVGVYSGDDKLCFYLENSKPIKILSTIKNYGVLRVYL